MVLSAVPSACEVVGLNRHAQPVGIALRIVFVRLSADRASPAAHANMIGSASRRDLALRIELSDT